MKPFLLKIESDNFIIYGVSYKCAYIYKSILGDYKGKTVRVSECSKEEADTAIVLGCTSAKEFYRISEVEKNSPGTFKNNAEIDVYEKDYLYSSHMEDMPEHNIMYKKIRKNMKLFKKYYIKFEVVK